MISAFFDGLCINCGGREYSENLWYGLPCGHCIDNIPEEKSIDSVYSILESKGKLDGFSRIYTLEKESENFSRFFYRIVGAEPWSLQMTWAKRLLKNESFVAIAPTGIGKTTFGIIASFFVEGKSYIVVPTKILMEFVKEKLEFVKETIGSPKRILVMNDKRNKEQLEKGDYDILVTTNMFLARNQDYIKEKFSFIFVDDVDSFLRQPKNIERTIKLMGLNDDDIQNVWKYIKYISEKRKKFIAERRRVYEEKTSADNNKESNITDDELECMMKTIRGKIRGVLVVSSATARAKTSRIKLFKEIFGFEVSPYIANIRNIEDVYTEIKNKGRGRVNEIFRTTEKFLREWGKGAFVYVNSEDGKDTVYKLKKFLTKKGIASVTYEEFNKENQNLFKQGKIYCVIGLSSLRNPLTRGIDMPESVRYTIFAGVPRFVFSLKEINEEPVRVLGAILALKNALYDDKISQRQILSHIEMLRRYVGMRQEDIERYTVIKERIKSIKEMIEKKLKDKNVIRRIERSEDIPVRKCKTSRGRKGGLKIVVADSPAYVQGSGRTSRLFVGGLSKGLSILIVDDKKAFFQLKKRFRFEMQDITFSEVKKSRIKRVLGEINRDRKIIKSIIKNGQGNKLSGQNLNVVKDKISPKSVLFVVESPNKAGTVARLIGKTSKRRIRIEGDKSNGNAGAGVGGGFLDVWEVSKGDMTFVITASGGHIFDLVKNEGKWGVLDSNGAFVPIYATIKRCKNCGESFEEELKCPYCGSLLFDDKVKVVTILRKLSEECDEVMLATDPDTEGEKIAWDIYLSVKLPGKPIRRVEYHEVTRKAIFDALRNTRDINIDLVKAQFLRRIADRWIGFFLSTKLQSEMQKFWLSAGRVQSPILGWLIEREEQMKNKVGIISITTPDDYKETFRIEKVKEARAIVKKLKKAGGKLTYKIISTSIEKINPPPPFSTSELLRDAANVLKYSAAKTMHLAQQIFEAGLITYHRTDSNRVSDFGMQLAREYITEKYGKDLSRPREWSKGGAHECIRPVRILEPDDLVVSVRVGTINIRQDAIPLYRLIFNNFIASQMKYVKVEKSKVQVHISSEKDILCSKEIEVITRILENGWNLAKFFRIPRVSEKLSNLRKKESREIEIKEASVSAKSPVAPYAQGSLIEEMKKRRIGRPSTWAQIIRTIIDRGYCTEKNGYLFPTKLGKEVFKYLSENYKYYSSEIFTKQLEEDMDKVETGEKDFQNVLRTIYDAIQQ